jgi:hypothetical protein
VCENGETGRDGNGGALARRTSLYDAEVPPLGFILTKLSTSESRTDVTRDDQTARALPAGSAAGSAGTHMAEAVCRHSYGLVDSAAGQPELAPVTDPSSQPSNGPTNIPGIGARLNPGEGW